MKIFWLGIGAGVLLVGWLIGSEPGITQALSEKQFQAEPTTHAPQDAPANKPVAVQAAIPSTDRDTAVVASELAATTDNSLENEMQAADWDSLADGYHLAAGFHKVNGQALTQAADSYVGYDAATMQALADAGDPLGLLHRAVQMRHSHPEQSLALLKEAFIVSGYPSAAFLAGHIHWNAATDSQNAEAMDAAGPISTAENANDSELLNAAGWFALGAKLGDPLSAENLQNLRDQYPELSDSDVEVMTEILQADLTQAREARGLPPEFER